MSEQTTEMVTLTRDERTALGIQQYGLYMLGMAMNDFERTDEDCAMDNIGVPRYKHELDSKQEEILKETAERHAYFTSPAGQAALQRFLDRPSGFTTEEFFDELTAGDIRMTGSVLGGWQMPK